MAHDRWCILRTSGGRTLALADSLVAAGIDAWTPRRTLRREKPGRCRLIDGSKPVVEIEAPILPTIVFAPVAAMAELATIAMDQRIEGASAHPGFSLFRDGDRYPLIGAGELSGLRQAEQEEAALLQAIRTAESRAEAKRIHIAGLRRQAERDRAARRAARERLQALRAERRDFAAGLEVVVAEAPSLAGLVGTVVKGLGRKALVSFGGSYAWEIEAWRLSPFHVDEAAARKSTAA